MATPPSNNPPPLAHITTTLRQDNRSLLLSTLQYDPRTPTTNGQDPITPYHPPESISSELQRQNLIFGTSHLRRTLLRNVLRNKDGGKRRKQKGNKTQVEEEEEMMSDLNEELLATGGGGLNASRKCITGSNILSTNGQILSPYTLTPSNDHDASITTYILRGGGFDLPSISNAVLHRRKMVGMLNRQQRSSFTGHLFRFVFVPRMTEVERSFLGELGVVDDFEGGVSSISMGVVRDSVRGSTGALTSLESLPIDLIPLDDDVWSLELAGGSGLQSVVHEGDAGAGKSGGLDVPSAACMRHSDVEGCEADVADVVARSLMKLQFLNRDAATADKELRGAISRVQGLGPLATAVIDRMMTLRMEEEKLEVQGEDEADDEEDQYQSDLPMDGTRSMDEVVSDGEDVEIRVSPSRRKENQASDGSHCVPSIEALLVIDRKIDLVTPMLTPLTYEGLIDDVLEIQVGGCVSVQRSLLEPDDDELQSKDSTVVLTLNDSDPLYKEVRNIHVEIFGTFLQNQAKALKESHSQFTNKETARDLTEIHQFVKQIPVFTRNLRSLTNHIHIAELVKSSAEASTFRQRWQTERSMLESEPCYEVIEDLIASGETPYRWLCLLCLQSLTSNGIKATKYDALRREVVQTYGYEFLLVLNDLEKAGFLRKRETLWMDSMATSYSTLRKALNLINAEVDPANPDDPAYVSSGYCPMTVRWIQASMRGYTGLDEAMRELPTAAGVGVGSGGGGGGRWIDVEQRSPPESLVDAMKRPRAQSLGTVEKSHSDPSQCHDGDLNKKPVLLVYFVGGVTYMEVAALRFLSKRPSFPYSLVICTTEIVNGRKLLQSLSC
ncbi:hypothetical protein ACHAWO_006456 [Cyclotella atomus]|uniref:Uncharacterized protein n=1 Tax=Cyclotella atomus TaxID=382360 RepID=A0ABD3NVR9_9STRA